jgi:hypothetical protein
MSPALPPLHGVPCSVKEAMELTGTLKKKKKERRRTAQQQLIAHSFSLQECRNARVFSHAGIASPQRMPPSYSASARLAYAFPQ